MTRKNKYRNHILGCLMICLVATSPNLMAQRISFGVFAGEDDISIGLPLGGNTELDFNQKQRILTSGSGQVVLIERDEGNPYLVYPIQAAEGFDLLIDVIQPYDLWLDGNVGSDQHIPFELQIAYNNQGVPTINSSIEAPPFMTSLIVPVSRSTSLAPGPPPDPLSGENSKRNQATFYLFLYGKLGPIGNVQAGLYSADIIINVSYANY